MEKDIYEIIVERLNKAGFVFDSDFEVAKNESMLIAGRYALCDRSRPDFRTSIKHTSKVASKLDITFDELEMLLAIVKEDGDVIPASLIVSKYRRDMIAVRSICSDLKRKGYLDGVESTPFREGGYKVTNRGLMCLLSEQPMDKLDTEPYIRLEAEDEVFPSRRKAISRNRMFPTDITETISGLFENENEQESRPKSKSVSVDVPFLEFLDGKIDEFCDGNLPMFHLLGLADMCLDCSQNKRFGAAFNSIGYQKFSNEQKTFLLMLCNHFAKNGAVPMNFSPKSSPVDVSSSRFKDLTSAAQALVTAGVVIIPPDDTCTNNKDEIVKERFMLSPDVVGAIFHGMTSLINYATLCKQADVWKCDSIEPKNLLFDKEMAEKVSCLNTLVDPKLSATLMKRLKEIGRKSLTCLFYGAPGVGKTELARQLARATGRDCIVVDPAKIDGSYWGDSEKNIREVFRAYKYLYKISDKAPILVFNEADGIITKRFTNVSRATEKSENAVQGIILQELESFEGIFIATTNLQENLDVASDRRFLYKLRFDYPSAKIRKQIISMKMKWVSEDDAASLAKEFCLSGGQVDNVATKCVIEKFMTGKEATLEKMRSFCREEISMRNPRLRQESRVGFIRYPQKTSK